MEIGQSQIQEVINEVTARNFGIDFYLPKRRVFCHYTPHPINYDLRNKFTPELVQLFTV